MEQEDHEWELSKENVQPLREGRCMSILAAALHSDQDEHTQSQRQREQQNNFELELRTYSGDDPFDVWDRYIKWTEQNFPRGGQDGQQIILIERCLREFQKNEKYLNDKRYIRLWTKFACYSDDPVVLYKYMYDNSIGERCAMFYVEWASAVERKGDMKTADQVYNLGLKLAAEPREFLIQSHQQFQSRVARNISLQIVEGQNPGLDFGATEEKRSTLARLKPKGASHVVGATRTGAAVLGSAGSLKGARAPVTKQVPSKGIPIYCDNENGSQAHMAQTHEWQSLPVRHVDNLENDKKPGAWSSAKVKQKPGSVPSVPQPCPFPIHIDEESEKHPDVTPRKTTVIGHTQPLSCHKASRTDVLSSVKPQETKEASNEVLMYQKDKIYNGLSEFSFEELRAVKYWKKKKEREAEALRLQQEEERKKTEEALRRQLQWTNERLARVEAIVLSMNKPLPDMADVPAPVPNQSLPDVQYQPSPDQSQTASIDSNNSLAVCTSSHVSVTSTSSAEAASSVMGDTSNDNQTPVNFLSSLNPGSGSSQSSTQKGAPRKENTSVSMSATKRTPIFNSASTYSSLLSNSSASLKLGKSHATNSFVKSWTHSATPSSVILAEHAPKDLGERTNEAAASGASSDQIGSSLESHNLSSVNVSLSTSVGKTPDTRSFKKKSISAPSPTVCTKEALQCVYGMFSAPIQEEENNDSLLSTSSQVHFPNGCRRPLDLSLEGSCGPPPKRQNLKSLAQMPASEKTPLASVGKVGLQIYQDTDSETMQLASSCEQKAVRRGLVFTASEDAEMTYEDKTLNVNKDFTIMSQAFSDITLAPLEYFSMTNKIASTPKFAPLSPLADNWEPTLEVAGALNSVPATLVSSSVAPLNYEEEEFHKSGNALSPIIENGESGSSEESAQQSQNTHLKSSEMTRAEKSGRTRLDSLQEEQCESSQWTLGVGKTPLPKSAVPEPIQEEAKEEEEDDAVAELPIIPNGNKLEKDLLDSSCQHVIDTTAYLNPEDSILDLSNSIALDPKDPFDEETIAGILAKLDPPLSSFENYHFFNKNMQCISKHALFWVIGESVGYYIMNAIGEGGNATVYEVKDINITDSSYFDEPENPIKAMKVQSPPCYWEFYISHALRKRLNKLDHSLDVRPGIIEIFQAFFYKDSSVLIMDLVDKGSLLNLVNKYKNVPSLLSDVEPFAVLLTIELLHMFEQIHKCEIIHGDVKPDNFLLKALPDIKGSSKDPREVFGKQIRIVQLIDYGQSIDMRQFKKGTTFTAKVSTSGFQCIEMRTQRPWTYQTDLFGLAGTIHVVLFGTYMNVYQEHGMWKTTGNFLRKWNVPLWKNLFNALLNVPSCHQQPDLAELRKPFEEYFMGNIRNYSKWIHNVQRL